MAPPCIPSCARLGIALAALVAASCASAPIAVPAVPAALVPSGSTAPFLKWYARGTQNYTCTARPDGAATEWKLTAPEATLYASAEPSAPKVGTHGVGPSWTANDGSHFLGDAAQARRVSSPDAGSIPWLLVPKTEGDPVGTLGGAAYVQRLDTAGGQPPLSGCDSSTVGAQVKVSYSATYVFYRLR